ncbi:Carbon monoxide dehydrogenase medium chain [subsurface metagenome]
MRDFDYFEPRNVDEAVSLLAKYGEAAKIMAGGTDLMVRMIMGTKRPKYIINLKATGLDYIECGDELRIGATTTIRAIAKSSELAEKCLIIANVGRKFASITIANMATIGGNICNASPAADTAAPLITLSARVKIIGPNGVRIVPLEEFFTGPGSTVMKPDEILTEIRIPMPKTDTKWAYIKYGIRGVSDLAITSVAALANIEDGIFTEAKIALGAVAPTPMRARRVEDALKGERANEKTIDKAAALVKEECCPISDVRASAEYRTQMSYVLTKRAIMSCLNS